MKGQNDAFGLILVLVIIFSILTTIAFIFGFRTPTQGQHTGIVTATEKNTNFPFGWITKGVYFKTSMYTSQEDQYCVIDDSLYQQLEYYQANQTVVTINFENGWFSMPWWLCGMGDTIIQGVAIK